jgi:hypothetical protein
MEVWGALAGAQSGTTTARATAANPHGEGHDCGCCMSLHSDCYCVYVLKYGLLVTQQLKKDWVTCLGWCLSIIGSPKRRSENFLPDF